MMKEATTASSQTAFKAVSQPTTKKAQKLCQASLNVIARQSHIQMPTYDRSKMKAGIVHFGVSNFFRAHFCTILDDLFNKSKRASRDWGIVGVSLTPNGVSKGHALRDQDFLTTVIEQTETETMAKITGPMIDYITTEEDGAEAILELLCEPSVRIVSLTITKGNYFIDPRTNKFIDGHRDVERELNSDSGPVTAFGYIVRALQHRREVGLPPFTVLSCDNLLHNGVAARESVAGLAKLLDSETDLSEWIRSEVAFPNAMVDRITPASGDKERQRCADEFGIEDSSPIFCERYRQLIIEDRFPAGRPNIEAVGVKFVEDVTPYENLKIKILNGGHMTLAHLGPLLGIQHVHEFMRHPVTSRFWHRVQRDSIVPSVECGPREENPADYYQLIAERFANPKILDGIQRLSDMGTTRLTNFINPTIRKCLERDLPIDGLAFIHALWATYCFGERAVDGEPIPNAGTADREWERLNEVARRTRTEGKPAIWLKSFPEVYPKEWAASGAHFRARFSAAIRAIWRHGVEKAVFGFSIREPTIAEQQPSTAAATGLGTSILRSNSRANANVSKTLHQFRELGIDEVSENVEMKKGRWERRRGSGVENLQQQEVI